MAKRIGITILMMLTLILVGAVFAQEEPYAPEIDSANFVEGIDNPYFPLTPGTTLIYEGETEDGTERTEVTVLSDTKEILGITCTVVRDTVWLDGELIEDTFDWYAQDSAGNVWYMGEDTHEYEDGVAVSTAGAWEAGVDGALPGIVMQASPEIGDSYRQEYYEGEAEDMAEVLSLTESAEVAYGSFDNLLMTNEWTPLEPDVAEHKYYAAGVGLVLEVIVEGGEGQIELIDVLTYDLAAMDDTGDDGEEIAPPDDTPLITIEAALEAAQVGDAAVYEVELENAGGRWVYSVQGGTDTIAVDAFTGEVLGIAGDDD